MTTLAIIADVHGNSIALQAVLDDLDTQGGADRIIMLGDLVVFGSDPRGALDLLRKRKSILFVRGNTDRYLIEEQYPRYPGNQDWKSQLLACFPWTTNQIGDAGLKFLKSLPAQHLLQFDKQHTVLAIHGSPRSDEENIRPDTPDVELAQMLGDQPYDLLLSAHTHVPVDRFVAGRRVANVGSVGLPFDGDTRASYGIIRLKPDGGYHIEQRRVIYNIDAVVEQLRATDHPAAGVITYNITTGLPISRKLVYTEKMRQGWTPDANKKRGEGRLNLLPAQGAYAPA